jgi:rhamnose utilization protein RhaD (predicted bifunctional aldolase and dehydrogenase)
MERGVCAASRDVGGEIVSTERNPISPKSAPPGDLLELCHALGDPEYAIIGDGNVSAIAEDRATFWVKASGCSLATMGRKDIVQVRMDAALAMLRGGEKSDEQVRAELVAAKVPSTPMPPPSIETVMHAALLNLPGVKYVGHTHPTAINVLTCSNRFEESLCGRIFPEEVVICGPESLLVPYADPGMALGREVGRLAVEFADRHGEFPRAIYLKNHGFIALGATAKEVLNVTMTSTKAAKIRAGAMALGGLSLLSSADVERIHRRPDVRYRQRIMGGA